LDFSFQDCEKINFRVIRPVCGILCRQPQQRHTGRSCFSLYLQLAHPARYLFCLKCSWGGPRLPLPAAPGTEPSNSHSGIRPSPRSLPGSSFLRILLPLLGSLALGLTRRQSQLFLVPRWSLIQALLCPPAAGTRQRLELLRGGFGFQCLGLGERPAVPEPMRLLFRAARPRVRRGRDARSHVGWGMIPTARSRAARSWPGPEPSGDGKLGSRPPAARKSPRRSGCRQPGVPGKHGRDGWGRGDPAAPPPAVRSCASRSEPGSGESTRARTWEEKLGDRGRGTSSARAHLRAIRASGRTAGFEALGPGSLGPGGGRGPPPAPPLLADRGEIGPFPQPRPLPLIGVRLALPAPPSHPLAGRRGAARAGTGSRPGPGEAVATDRFTGPPPPPAPFQPSRDPPPPPGPSRRRVYQSPVEFPRTPDPSYPRLLPCAGALDPLCAPDLFPGQPRESS
jgi:hypothetical protein